MMKPKVYEAIAGTFLVIVGLFAIGTNNASVITVLKGGTAIIGVIMLLDATLSN